MKKITLLILLLEIYFNSYSQTDTININNTFETSETIYSFTPNQTIYGLRINGSISYTDYTSLARVVLVKSDSSELLIYEAYPWLYYYNGNGSFYFSNAGDETYYLDAMDVSYIKVEIFNAKIDITTMLIDTVYNSNIPTLRTQYVDSLRQNKIDSINNNIQAHNLLWFAYDNEVAQMTFQNKKKRFSGDSITSIPFNSFGIEYFKGGIFSIIGAPNPSKSSNFVDKFDWRNRHGKNWVTPIKDQGNTNWCSIFTYNAVLEAIINLYYNKQLNIILSEQAFHSCAYTIYRSQGSDQWFSNLPPSQLSCSMPCDYYKIGAIEESCYPTSLLQDIYGYDTNGLILPHDSFPPNYPYNFPNWGVDYSFCIHLCPNHENYLWKPDSIFEVHAGYQPDIDVLKESIILKGPITSCFYYHYRAIVGFGTVQLGDTIYPSVVGDMTTPIIVVGSNNQNLIGATYWIEKESVTPNQSLNGFLRIIHDFCDVGTYCPQSFYTFTTPITPSINSGLTTDSIKCIDNDGDGYFWWGIGAKPSTCPLFAPNERDCDDSDPFAGPYDNEYNCTPICVYNNGWTEVNSDTTIDNNLYIATNIKVKSGHTLKIENHATLFVHHSSQIIVENGATLHLDNGNIIICNNDPWQGSITAELGAQLIIENESILIEKSQEWMPANMNVGTKDYPQLDDGVIQKYCYNDVESNCYTYGGLYQWGEALQYASSVNCDPCGPTIGKGGVQGICPTGYHIPSDLEWSRYEWTIENKLEPTGSTDLSTFQNGTSWRGSTTAGVGPGDKMKTKSWNGTNTSGFTALPAGYSSSSQSWDMNSTANFWSATESSSTFAWYRILSTSSVQSCRTGSIKSIGYSVRCLKD